MYLPTFSPSSFAYQLTREGMPPDQADRLARLIDARDEELSRHLRRMDGQLTDLSRRNRDLEAELKEERRRRDGLTSNTEWLSIGLFCLANLTVFLFVLFI